MTTPAAITADQIEAGLRELGLTQRSDVVVHASLRSFGTVAGGARTVVAAVSRVCRTMIMMAGSWELCGLPAPPGLVRPRNAYWNAADWPAFDRALQEAVPYGIDLPVDRWLGAVAEALRVHDGAVRGPHPLLSFAGVGENAHRYIAQETLERPLGALEALVENGGHVLQLGVTHTSNTTMHVAEQRLGRGLFYRYARLHSGVWAELPNISGESHRFDDIEPLLRPYSRETMIGGCRARLIPARDVVRVTTEVIMADPGALLCADAGCRCVAARLQLETGSRPG